jgi:hypothetical protein
VHRNIVAMAGNCPKIPSKYLMIHNPSKDHRNQVYSSEIWGKNDVMKNNEFRREVIRNHQKVYTAPPSGSKSVLMSRLLQKVILQ